MKKLQRLFIIAFLLMGLCPVDGSAHEFMLGNLLIGHPWARASIGAATAGAAYLTITNQGTTSDRLVGASTPVAEKAELHTHLMEDGIMKMRQVEGVDVEPGAPVEFQPSGLHVMLIGLKEPLIEGKTFPLTLTFQKAGKVKVNVIINSSGTTNPNEGHMAH